MDVLAPSVSSFFLSPLLLLAAMYTRPIWRKGQKVRLYLSRLPTLVFVALKKSDAKNGCPAGGIWKKHLSRIATEAPLLLIYGHVVRFLPIVFGIWISFPDATIDVMWFKIVQKASNLLQMCGNLESSTTIEFQCTYLKTCFEYDMLKLSCWVKLRGHIGT